MVPMIGVEPIRILLHRILSPARLPIPPHRRGLAIIVTVPDVRNKRRDARLPATRFALCISSTVQIKIWSLT